MGVWHESPLYLVLARIVRLVLTMQYSTCLHRYVAATDYHSLRPRVLRQTDNESLSFVTSPGLRTSRRVMSWDRYDKYDIITDLGGPAKPVIPTPLSLQHRYPHSWVSLDTHWTVAHQPKLVHEARLLTGQLFLLCFVEM